MLRTADAVVIGGGIMGSSLAYFLTKIGAGRVVLLEKYLLASGSTGHSAANVRQHYSNKVTALLAKRAVEMFSQFDDELGYPVGFQQVGYMIMAREQDKPAIEHVVRLQQSLGMNTRVIDRDDVEELSPGADLTEVVGGCFEPTSGYADPRATVYALAHRAVEKGAVLEQLTQVQSIRTEGDRVTGVVTNRGEITTPIVVNCAGPWAGRVGRMAGMSYSLRFSRELDVKVQMPAAHGSFPVTADPANGSYYRPQVGGFAVVGLAFPKELEPCDPDTYEDKARASEIEMVAGKLMGRVPSLRAGLPVSGWAGVYTITDDWHPIIGDAPGLRGYYHFFGGSGHGFKIAPPMGEALADIITGRTPQIDISPLHYRRFEAGQEFRSAWGPGNRA